jgi:hypothetical protein
MQYKCRKINTNANYPVFLNINKTFTCSSLMIYEQPLHVEVFVGNFSKLCSPFLGHLTQNEVLVIAFEISQS